jgi:hypothetical protein
MREVSDKDVPAYFAVDPGLATGVACYAPAAGYYNAVEVLGGDIGFANFWRVVLHDYTVAGIVCESFHITPQTATKTRQYDALYIIGWLKLESQRLGIPFTLQTPAQGKSFGTDAKLKHMGWYVKTKDGHRNDASRHLLTFLSTRDSMIRSALAAMLTTGEDQSR